jgi:hypothetical protein
MKAMQMYRMWVHRHRTNSSKGEKKRSFSSSLLQISVRVDRVEMYPLRLAINDTMGLHQHCDTFLLYFCLPNSPISSSEENDDARFVPHQISS